MRYSSDHFDRWAREALAEIPECLRACARNVAIVIADAPTDEQLRAFGMGDGETLYGCYEGIALTERGFDGEPLLPDRIILFRQSLEDDFGHDAELLRREIAATIRHELAHHFGIDDDRLEELGKY